MLRSAFLVALGVFLAPAALAQSAPAPCVNGTATLSGRTYTCSGIDLYSVTTPQQMGANAPDQCTQPYPNLCANDIWGWTDPVDGHEYAVVGLHNGTAFVDVTDPAAPRRLGRLPSQAASSSWRDVKVYQNVALIVSEANNHGMQVFDLTTLRGLTEDATRTFTANAVYNRIGSAHNVAVNEATGFAYAVGNRTQGGGLPSECGIRGVHAINLQDPLNPTFAGCFNDAARETGPRTPGYTHDIQCVVYSGPDTDYTGREICLAANEDVVTVFDVTDKDNVAIVSQGAYPGFAYTHQAWFSADQRYMLANDEIDELNGEPFQRTLVFDMVDLDMPEFTSQYTSALTTVDHNLYVKGNLAYESNYEAGLRVIDLSGIATGALSESAFFDTYPQSTNVAFNGQWSNYPYFPSGTVLASDAANGLFVLRLTGGSTAGAPAPESAARVTLSAPVPNPASGEARIRLSVPTPQRVRAVLIDALGREVAVLLDGRVEDTTDLTVRASALPAGTYVVRVVGERETATRALAIAR